MATDIAINHSARSMLVTTLQTIHQLKQSEREHLKQQAEIFKHITSLEMKLREAKKQHMDLKASLAAISHSIAQMELVERNLRCSMSPMKHLPEDILLYIFRISARELDSTRNEVTATWTVISKAERCTLLRLSGVCARWRAVLASNPSLLTTVEVRMQPESDGERDQERQLVAHSMKAGKACERTLFLCDWDLKSLSFCQKLLGYGPMEWKAIHISILTDPVGSWDIGKLRAREVKLFRQKSRTIQYFTPLLRHASVVVLYGSPPQWGSLPWIHLRSLSIKNFASDEYPSGPPLSFGSAQLTALLSAAAELTELILDFTVDEAKLINEDHPVVTHPNLSSLSLHLHHFVAGKGPFGVELRAPALQKLDFISLRYTNPTEETPFLCSDHPKVLSLPTMNDEEEEVLLAVELSKWLPDVHTMEVKGQNVNTLFVFFHTLFHCVPPHPLPLPLPKLSTLFIADTDLRGETLIELLESRLRHVQGNTPGVCAITEVNMYNSPAVTPAHWRRVQELLGEGMKTRQ